MPKIQIEVELWEAWKILIIELCKQDGLPCQDELDEVIDLMNKKIDARNARVEYGEKIKQRKEK